MVANERQVQERADLGTTLLVAGYDDDGIGRVYRSRAPDAPVREVLSTAGPAGSPEWIGDVGFLNDLLVNFVLASACDTLDHAVDLAVRLISITESFQYLARERLSNHARVLWTVHGPATLARLTPA